MRSETRPISGLMIASRPAIHEPERADGDRAEPELLEPQRGEHPEHSEEHRRQEHEPDADDDPAIPECTNEDGERLSTRGRRRVRQRGPDGKADRDQARGAERKSLAHHRGDASQDRSEQGAGDRRRHRGSDRLPATIRRGLADEPCQAGRPGERAAETLDEARHVEHEDGVARREDEGRDRDRDQPGDRRRTGAEAGSGDSARYAADQRSDRVGGREDAGAGLGEPELVRVAGQQRRQGDEEHRVDEDDPADQQQKPPQVARGYFSVQLGFRRSRKARRPS